jgi:hypothetical protein
MTRDFFHLLKASRLVLKRIRLNHLQDYYDVFVRQGMSGEEMHELPLNPLDLPVVISKFLLGYTNLENLEIAGWTLPKTASGHKILFGNTSNLKNITIHLIDLLAIAKSHPDLASL